MRNVFRWILGGALVALTGWWGTNWYVARNLDLTLVPPQSYSTATTEVPASFVLLPMQVRPAGLEELANQLPRHITIPRHTHTRYASAFGIRVGQASIHTDGNIARGPIRIAVSNGALTGSTYLDGSLRAYKGSLQETARGSAEVTAKLKLDISSDWTLVAKPEISYRWRSRPHVDVLGIRVSLGSEAANAIDPELRRLEARIARELPERLALRKSVESLWVRLQEPVEIGPDLWLTARPTRLYMPTPTTTDGMYQVLVGVECRLSLRHGARPAIPAVSPLPPLDKGRPPVEGIALIVPVDLEYAAMRAQLLRAYAEQLFAADIPGVGKVQVRLHDVRIYGNGPRLVVGARVQINSPQHWLDTRGWIYLQGTPRYEPERQILEIPDLDFSAVVDNTVVELLSTALRDRIRDELRRGARVDLSSRIADLKSEVERRMNASLGEMLPGDQLDERTRKLLGTRVTATGHVDQISAGSIVPGAASVRVDAIMDGALGLQLVPEAAENGAHAGG